jgi:hypothetical protein
MNEEQLDGKLREPFGVFHLLRLDSRKAGTQPRSIWSGK